MTRAAARALLELAQLLAELCCATALETLAWLLELGRGLHGPLPRTAHAGWSDVLDADDAQPWSSAWAYS